MNTTPFADAAAQHLAEAAQQHEPRARVWVGKKARRPPKRLDRTPLVT
jgi:hypothetical protein